MPPEFYLIIFLMVAMLIYVYLYGERAQKRRADRDHAKDSSPNDATRV